MSIDNDVFFLSFWTGKEWLQKEGNITERNVKVHERERLEKKEEKCVKRASKKKIYTKTDQKRHNHWTFPLDSIYLGTQASFFPLFFFTLFRRRRRAFCFRSLERLERL